MVENLIIGIVSGVISGLIVAFSLTLLSRYRKPPLELIHVGQERAVLKNNRKKALVVGGTWELGNGSVLSRPDGFRGGEGGFFVPRYGEFVVATRSFSPGQTAEIVYKYVKNTSKRGEIIRLEEENQIDASTVAISPEDHPEWKVARVPLRGFS